MLPIKSQSIAVGNGHSFTVAVFVKSYGLQFIQYIDMLTCKCCRFSLQLHAPRKSDITMMITGGTVLVSMVIGGAHIAVLLMLQMHCTSSVTSSDIFAKSLEVRSLSIRHQELRSPMKPEHIPHILPHITSYAGH